MPFLLRRFFSYLCVATFFAGCLVLGFGIFPLFFLFGIFDRGGHRRRCTRVLGVGYGTFLLMMRVLGQMSWGERLRVPPELEGKPYVIVANHPSWIDVVYLLHWFPGSTCVAKGSWSRSFFFGTMLRSTNYIPTDVPEDEASLTGALDRMVEHVKSGHPLIIFPEGTRSDFESLRRFRRGAFEIAARSGAPLLPVFIRCDQPFLMKGMSVWEQPNAVAHYEFEAWPPVDVAKEVAAGRTAKEICAEYEDTYRERFARWVERRRFPAAPRKLASVSDPAE